MLLEFSSVLMSVDCLKLKIRVCYHWKIYTAHQFCDFQYLLFSN